MPTSYTCKIEDGTIRSGRDFAKLCLNAFGIMYHNIDNPPTMEAQDFTKVHSEKLAYHNREIADAKRELREREDAFEDDYDNYMEMMRDNLNDEIRRNMEMITHYESTISSYEEIRGEIEAWDCSEDCRNLKTFCLEQIDKSIPLSALEYIKKETETLEMNLADFDNYFKEKHLNDIRALIERIKYHMDSIGKIERNIRENQEYYDKVIGEIERIGDKGGEEEEK